MSADWKTHEREHEAERQFRVLMESVERLLKCGSLHCPLTMAARLVEAAAYEAASSEEPYRVSRMIMLAADIEALADQYPRRIMQAN